MTDEEIDLDALDVMEKHRLDVPENCALTAIIGCYARFPASVDSESQKCSKC
jgi:hypothetical protein